jgi:thymidylate kinase
MKSKKRGKMIVLYGINNLGKTTQAKLLVKNLKKSGHQAEYLKYPIYDLEPSGTILNNFLREGNKYRLSRRDAQFVYALNRTQYEEKLLKKLDKGTNIVAEDYTGTGLAWGIGSGVDEKFLLDVNAHLFKEDLGLLFDGKRFMNSVEKRHKHETDRSLIKKVRQAHLYLGKKYGWQKINANLSIKDIREIVWNKVKKILK